MRLPLGCGRRWVSRAVSSIRLRVLEESELIKEVTTASQASARWPSYTSLLRLNSSTPSSPAGISSFRFSLARRKEYALEMYRKKK